MFLSAEEIADSRRQAALHALELTAACLNAGQRLHELFSTAGHEAFQQGGARLASMSPYPADLWLAEGARHSQLLDAACRIAGDAHKALIENAEAQIRVLDGVVFAGIRRAARLSPWEIAVALRAWRTALEHGEETLHGISEAAHETVDLAGREVHQISEALLSRPAATGRRQRKP